MIEERDMIRKTQNHAHGRPIAVLTLCAALAATICSCERQTHAGESGNNVVENEEVAGETEIGEAAQTGSLDLLTFAPASPEGQTLTEDGKSPPILIQNYNETAIDALGRSLPTSAEVGLPQSGKYVGLFYSLWTSEISAGGDNAKAMACDPLNPDYGSYASFCFWSEPETGYHKADDVWQIRRDLNYFAMAGVDFLYIDMTNGELYEEAMTTFLDTCIEMRAEGQMTPYVVPWAYGSARNDGAEDMGLFYELFMTQEKYADMWFYWDGKPLGMIKPLDDGTYPILDDAEMTERMTFRKSWVPPTDRAEGYWVDNQIVNDGYGFGWTENADTAECAGIGCAGFANFGSGRSRNQSNAGNLDAFLETPTMGEGKTLQTAFEMLMKRNPECQVLLISRWNEWIAQNFSQDHATDTGFVDQFNPEFSRDIEPMKGGYTDNYFYQMCSIIRRFKGVLPADDASEAATIDIDGDFSVWQNVSPVFTDFQGDVSRRDSTDTTGAIRYVNETGRNDVVESRLTANGGMVYVYARTAEKLSPFQDGRNWMLLFIDADDDKSTGWEGYDYLINYAIVSDAVTTLCAWRDGIWQEIGTVSWRAEGNELMIALPRVLLGLTNENFTLNFHWMDNVTNVYDLESWFTTGDSAPERRNNYSVSLSIPYDPSAETLLPGRGGDGASYMPAAELNADEIASLAEGLLAVGYRLSAQYGKIPDFRLIEANAVETHVVNALAADVFSKLTANYGLTFEGYLLLEADGERTFTLTCDDGARLYIDGRLLLECPYDVNRPANETVTADVSLRLAAGYHAIRVEYAEISAGGARLSLDAPGEFYYKSVTNAGLILREDFDETDADSLSVNFELDGQFDLTNGKLTGTWVDGRAVRYRGSDLRFYSMETRIVANDSAGTAYRTAIALRIPSELSIGNSGGVSAYEPDNGDEDPTSYLGKYGIYLYCAGDQLEIAIHVRDSNRRLSATSIGYSFALPQGASFREGVVVRFEDLGDVVRVYCDDILLATVLLSDEGSIDGQPFKGSGYRAVRSYRTRRGTSFKRPTDMNV